MDLKAFDEFHAATNRLLEAIRADVARTQGDGYVPPLIRSQGESPAEFSLPERPPNWKQAVLDVIAGLPATFRFSDVYKDEEWFAKYFPGNRSIMQSVATALRDLVNEKQLENPERGLYRKMNVGEVETVDTIVVPAHSDGFYETFLGERKWYEIRIHQSMIPKIKNVAVYRTSPTSAITHIAPVQRIQPRGNSGKYEIEFSSEPHALDHPVEVVPGGEIPPLRNIRYTSRERLEKAKTLDDVWS